MHGFKSHPCYIFIRWWQTSNAAVSKTALCGSVTHPTCHLCGGSIIVVQESSKLRASERNRVTAPFWSRSSIGQSTALSRQGLRVRVPSTPYQRCSSIGQSTTLIMWGLLVQVQPSLFWILSEMDYHSTLRTLHSRFESWRIYLHF